MKVGIINIGDEILIGQIVNTNATWMSSELTSAGCNVTHVLTVGDNASDIISAIDEVWPHVEVILMTGGLGPTKDDITKKILCEYFDTHLIFREDILDNIKAIWGDSLTMNDLTKSQAYIPESCHLIQNKVGSAPIMCFEREGKMLVSMPGVPSEMRSAMTSDVIPLILSKYTMEEYLKLVLTITGYSESALAIYLTNFENSLPEGFGLAYLPSEKLVKLRLFARGIEYKTIFEKKANELKTLLKDNILVEGDISLVEALATKLKSLKYTLSTAESCTGGNVSKTITQLSGASEYFMGSIVSYANAVKQAVLGVSKETLDRVGAVSEEVVVEMSRGVQKLMKTNCSIAISGIAGPTGGTPDKPVGTIWVATTCNEAIQTQCYHLGKVRDMNISAITTLAIIQLLKMIK